MVFAVIAILLALVLVGGSIFWLLPSPSERRRMRLRERAFAQGVRVREARQEMKEWGLDPRVAGTLMQYYLFVPEAKTGRWTLVNPRVAQAFREPAGRVVSSGDVPAGTAAHVECWEKQPSDLLAWERHDQRFGFYWFEQADEAGLDGALEALKRLVSVTR